MGQSGGGFLVWFGKAIVSTLCLGCGIPIEYYLDALRISVPRYLSSLLWYHFRILGIFIPLISSNPERRMYSPSFLPRYSYG